MEGIEQGQGTLYKDSSMINQLPDCTIHRVIIISDHREESLAVNIIKLLSVHITRNYLRASIGSSTTKSPSIAPIRLKTDPKTPTDIPNSHLIALSICPGIGIGFGHSTDAPNSATHDPAQPTGVVQKLGPLRGVSGSGQDEGRGVEGRGRERELARHGSLGAAAIDSD